MTDPRTPRLWYRSPCRSLLLHHKTFSEIKTDSLQQLGHQIDWTTPDTPSIALIGGLRDPRPLVPLSDLRGVIGSARSVSTAMIPPGSIAYDTANPIREKCRVRFRNAVPLAGPLHDGSWRKPANISSLARPGLPTVVVHFQVLDPEVCKRRGEGHEMPMTEQPGPMRSHCWFGCAGGTRLMSRKQCDSQKRKRKRWVRSCLATQCPGAQRRTRQKN